MIVLQKLSIGALLVDCDEDDSFTDWPRGPVLYLGRGFEERHIILYPSGMMLPVSDTDSCSFLRLPDDAV